MWDLQGTGLEPVSPALAGGFLTTMPLRKSLNLYLKSTVLMLVVLLTTAMNIKAAFVLLYFILYFRRNFIGASKCGAVYVEN